jgi:hypothetical protein
MIRHYRLLFIALSALLFSGCPNPAAYREPITRFQQASTIVIEGARIEYSRANQTERDAEIDRLVAQRSRIELSHLNDPTLRLLDPDSLNARMAMLDTLSKHGQLLLTLASSDAPGRAKDAANSLDDAIVGLSSALGNAPSDQFKNVAQGFATLAGEAAQLALENKIQQALNKAVIASEQNITTLLNLLKDDLGDLYERRRNYLSAARKHAVDVYNLEIKQNSPPEVLKAAAEQVKNAEDAWDNLPLLLGAGPGLDAMTEAHKSLVNYAKSPKTPQNLVELVDATDAFANRAKVIADAIRAIQ